MVDASFNRALQLLGIDVGWYENPGMDLAEWHAWSALGSRLAMIILLGTIASIATAVALLRLFFGRGFCRTLKGLLSVMFMVGAWLALYAQYGRLSDKGMLYRIGRDISDYEAAALQLQTHWGEPGQIPGVGVFFAPYRTSPDVVEVRSIAARENSWRTTVRGPVLRQSDGTLTFDYFAVSRSGQIVCLQYKPAGSEPQDWEELDPTSGIIEKKVERTVQVKPNWFLVWYAVP